jgi:hypothetical protein
MSDDHCTCPLTPFRDDPYYQCPFCERQEEDDGFCANCGGNGFTYGCSWDWQCDTYDEGEGTCLCTRHCDWCNPAKPTAETAQLQAVLASALAQTPSGDSNDRE